MEQIINMALLTMMAVITVGIIRMKNLFGVVILAGVYSFLMASVMIVLDAVDVAMTEASVGAGVSTVLLLGALALTKTEAAPSRKSPLVAIALAVVVGGLLIYQAGFLPGFGLATSPVHTHVGPYYIENSLRDTGVPNVVTSVLASYRGFDTLGETAVIFTAGIGVLLLLKGRNRRKKADEKADALTNEEKAA